MDRKTKVYEIVKKFSTTMLVTCGPGNRLAARPMQIARVDDSGEIWFFTGRHGRIAEETGHETHVLLVFEDERNAYLSLRGTARIVQDRALMKEIWKEPFQVWFPGGVDDPELALISVEPTSAEYWDSGGLNRLEYLFEAAKAYVHGTRPDVSDADQHAKVSM